MDTTAQNWKKLIRQAFTNQPCPAAGRCSPLCLYRHIYQALNQAGIGNRSPFGVVTFFVVWCRSLSNDQPLNLLLVEALDDLRRPARGFYPHGQWASIIALLLPLAMLVPHCASTFNSDPQTASMLRFIPLVSADADQQETRLPSTTDYLLAANQFLDHPVLFPRQHGLFGAQWIAHQPDEHYTLQVLSTGDFDGLVNLCQTHQISAQCAYQQTKVKTRTVYRLFYGSYADRDGANHASASLPPQLQKLKPWLRRFSQIRQSDNS
jgi:hypothetical protein